MITGASAGIGRAAARLFAEGGADVGLIARGQAGQDAAAAEVSAAGGTPLALPADVANFDEVDAAASRVEAELGPIDVWVNVAFASVFAPFSWVRSRLPHQPEPVPPIYQPEIAARAVVFAAGHPQRKQYWVAGTTAATVLASRIAPGLLDRYLARTGYRAQQTSQPAEPGRPDNLDAPLDSAPGTDHGAHGSFDDRSHRRSLPQWLAEHATRPVAGRLAAPALSGRRGGRRH